MALISSTATAEAKQTRAGVQPAALAASICAGVFVLYLGTAWFGFVLDDIYQVLDTAAIHSWRYFGGYFTTPTFATPYYRPLLLTWFRINDALFGQNPAGWHLTNVGLHVAVTALVYALARRLGGSSRLGLVTALIFGVHPIHIESVAWVSDACDLLAAIFLLSALLAYIRGERQGGWKVIAVASYALALLTKESAVAFPAVIAVYAFIYRGGEHPHICQIQADVGHQGLAERVRRAWVACLPFVVLTLVYLYWHQKLTASLGFGGSKISTTTALLTIPWVLTFYLRKLVAPVGLSAFYDNVYVSKLGSWEFLLPLGALAVIAAAVWVWQRRSKESRLIAFSAWWFLLTLTPTLYLPKLPYNEAAHDRYLYLPSVGFVILAAIALEQLAGSAAQRKWTIPGVAVGLAVVLAGLNVSQQVFYANDLLIHRRGVAIAPHNDRARNNLGRVLAERGDLHEAEAMFVELIRRSPDSGVAHYNLGYTYYREGRYSDAEEQLRRALALDSGNPFVHLYLGLTALREGKTDLAEREVGRAVGMRPGQIGFHLAMGYVLEAKGDLPGALRETRTELAYSPENAAIRERAVELQRKIAER